MERTKYKIFDTSALISLIFEAKTPEVLMEICNLGYHILIPKEVFREIKDVSIVAELLRDGRIDLCPEISSEQIKDMKKRFPYFHDGEISVLLTYNKLDLDGRICRCIIDEKDAKSYSLKNGINVNGVLGCILWLKEKGKINKSDCHKIYMNLQENPRLPKNLLEGLTK